MKPGRKNLILTLLVVLIAGGPLLYKAGAEFAGADEQAKNTIAAINSDYKPWFKPVWQPPSAEVEGFIFALQAALGSGIVCYYLGFKKGQRSRAERDSYDSD